ncbi:MAG: tRNA U-34 5-methylaminomethyl-2-thiouridine biosynthesis protein [Candidatus Poseidoniia archaeon]|jgi:2-aminophenol/2-amino-5-chlorophenol 1,6-dioxygenase beta subunit|nr:tRNA U-34 5-methylaminomethyl-2-thiouridine biosynthesis protein [Euryarchaeota archaeon]MDP6489150.1 tRNA U-34 5-methylaminomethyl-2-thiouridine biosynthesis protein [Candidatus Poseidoniia archaeon]MDP6534566.1 tRNA U-34 5-methylaminomethyl-2-thiouridine biosynthesis protein [Candidatus Poseidoniia archaeon]MDP6834702.1 tRNA U-34 5-methylaminomethyl-2-thiouridine biosynthesis protein [Candidatus Poseidoniia archaeon]|tara:strand:- start:786 stop:1673 length:888 start_codon:yes stop_codon:yes gene_type:complete
MAKGEIVMGALAPHPPHLVYAENPSQNEPVSEGGWEELRWGYERLRKSLADKEFDVIIIHTPHWQTYVGTHFLGVPHFKNLSVDPIFPNLFRYNYDLTVDVELSRSIHDHAAKTGLHVQMMENPDFRIDYGTITSCHLVRPDWDLPIVCISSNRSRNYFSVEVMQANMVKLGQATREAIEASGKRALLLSSNSLSHRHFTEEPEVPEDMSQEHITNHHQYLWDMKMIELMCSGKTREMIDIMPDFTEQTVAETDAGSLTWLMSALDFPEYQGEIHAYGTVIGTGNAIIGWDPASA